MSRFASLSAALLFASALLHAQNIRYDDARKIWLITTTQSSYAIGVSPDGQLQHLYWGAPLSRMEDPAPARTEHDISSFDSHQMLENEEYPGWGGPRYYEPAVKITRADGNRDLVLHYASHKIDGDELIITMRDIKDPIETELHYRSYSDPKNKAELVLKLLPQAFAWARTANASQPLTSGVWHDIPAATDAQIPPMAKVQLELSDVVSFHNYDPAASFAKEVTWLKRYGRPIICTEYMARPQGSTFQAILPVAKDDRVGMINWGFVAGKSQTYLPWDSWKHPYTDRQPAVWFHDIFHEDGKPYRPEEVAFIRKITGAIKQ